MNHTLPLINYRYIVDTILALAAFPIQLDAVVDQCTSLVKETTETSPGTTQLAKQKDGIHNFVYENCKLFYKTNPTKWVCERYGEGWVESGEEWVKRCVGVEGREIMETRQIVMNVLTSWLECMGEDGGKNNRYKQLIYAQPMVPLSTILLQQERCSQQRRGRGQWPWLRGGRWLQVLRRRRWTNNEVGENVPEGDESGFLFCSSFLCFFSDVYVLHKLFFVVLPLTHLSPRTPGTTRREPRRRRTWGMWGTIPMSLLTR